MAWDLEEFATLSDNTLSFSYSCTLSIDPLLRVIQLSYWRSSYLR